jgi:hypothetical protein
MTAAQIVDECGRLWDINSEADTLDLFKIFKGYFLKSTLYHPFLPDQRDELINARMINQMMLTKILHLEQSILGVECSAPNGDRLTRIIDPNVIAALVRTIFETVGTFNCVFVQPETDDEKLILHRLWMSASLKRREKFRDGFTSPEHLHMIAKEQQWFDDQMAEINATQTWKNMPQRERDIIDKKIKDKEYTIKFQNGRVKSLAGFQEMIKTAGANKVALGNMYFYLSLNTHPSYMSVSHFFNMFNPEDPRYRYETKHYLKVAFMLIGMFVADYIKVFPEMIDNFNTIDERDQCVINFWNTTARPKSYSISDCLDRL